MYVNEASVLAGTPAMRSEASDWCGRKPDDPSPIVYHGGWHRRFLLSACLQAGVEYFGCSFYEMRKVPDMLKRLRDQVIEPASDWLGPQPRDPKPVVYHGGAIFHGTTNISPCLEAGVKTFGASYYDVRKHRGYEKGLPRLLKQKRSRLFMDSGAFSFLVAYRKNNNLSLDIDTYLKEYAEFIRQTPLPLDFYVTFDYRPDARITWDMTKRLQKLGIRPIPVYHGDASIDWVKKYIDQGHQLIGLSKRFFLNDRSGLRRFYDQTFKITEAAGIACHGFACTGPEMWEYPWHSVDSTTIIGAASRGSLAYVENGEFKMFPIGKNRIGNHLPKDLQDTIQRFGYRSLKDFEHYSPRIEFCMRRFLEYQKTRQAKSWTKRSLF
jgi:hypothetical protein